MAAAAALEPWRAAAPRRRRSAARRPRTKPAAAAGDPEPDPEVDDGVVLRRVREAREDLRVSDFWSSALETISTCLKKHLEQLDAPVGALSEAIGSLHLDSSPGDSGAAPGSIPGETPVPGTGGWKCVCYGIGSFATCAIARSQLAFLLLFLEKCQIPRSHCWVYDPVFSQLEIAVLTTLGVTVLGENEEGKRSVRGEPTVFYMLHCGTALYNNLLWSNWSADALSKVVIIGNSFRGLEERLLTRILQKNYAYVAKVLEGLEEQAFPQTAQYSDVFNDTSVHWFPVQKLKQLPTDTWASREEPDYRDCEDLEIIRNQAGASATGPTGCDVGSAGGGSRAAGTRGWPWGAAGTLSSQGQFRREQEALSLALEGRGDVLWKDLVSLTSLSPFLGGLAGGENLLNREVTLSKMVQKI